MPQFITLGFRAYVKENTNRLALFTLNIKQHPNLVESGSESGRVSKKDPLSSQTIRIWTDPDPHLHGFLQEYVFLALTFKAPFFAV